MAEPEKLKRFINCYVPTGRCNFRCEYCYITLKRQFDGNLFKMQVPLEHFRKAVSKKRLGGMCLFNLCAGGETLLSPEIIPVIRVLLEEGHNVAVVTNGTCSASFEKLAELEKALLEMLYFKFSFQYLELIRTNTLDIFFQNVKRMRDVGCSFSIDITPHDRLIPHIPEIKRIFMEQLGALPHLGVARDTSTNELKLLTEMSREEYIATWSVFESEKFNYRMQEFLKPHHEYCHAGDWTFSLEIGTGNMRKCDGAPVPKEMDFYNLYENPDEEIKFEAIGHNCPVAHCYNCHALLALGTIPELQAPTYTEMLDRVDNEGRHWLSPRLRELYSHKLIESYDTQNNSENVVSAVG